MKQKLIVIYYHEVVESGQGFSYQKMEKDKFEQQMKYLQEHQYHTLLFEDLGKPLPDKAIIVSFDDGFKSVYENAVPIMQKYGIKANIYLPTNYVGQDEHFMTWDMIRELQQTGNYEFAAHTHNHVDIRTLDETEMRSEIASSTEMFQRELQLVPNAFCMPYGTFDRKSIALLRRNSDYKYLLGSCYGTMAEKQLQNRIMPRIGISNEDSIGDFERKLLGKFNWKGPLQLGRLFVKSILGDRVKQYEY